MSLDMRELPVHKRVGECEMKRSIPVSPPNFDTVLFFVVFLQSVPSVWTGISLLLMPPARIFQVIKTAFRGPSCVMFPFASGTSLNVVFGTEYLIVFYC